MKDEFQLQPVRQGGLTGRFGAPPQAAFLRLSLELPSQSVSDRLGAATLGVILRHDPRH